jgi:hypothetical protein
LTKKENTGVSLLRGDKQAKINSLIFLIFYCISSILSATGWGLSAVSLRHSRRFFCCACKALLPAAPYICIFAERFGDYDPAIMVNSLKSGVAREKSVAGARFSRLRRKWSDNRSIRQGQSGRSMPRCADWNGLKAPQMFRLYQR